MLQLCIICMEASAAVRYLRGREYLKHCKIDVALQVIDHLALRRDLLNVKLYLGTVAVFGVLFYWNTTCKCNPHRNEQQNILQVHFKHSSRGFLVYLGPQRSTNCLAQCVTFALHRNYLPILRMLPSKIINMLYSKTSISHDQQRRISLVDLATICLTRLQNMMFVQNLAE